MREPTASRLIVWKENEYVYRSTIRGNRKSFDLNALIPTDTMHFADVYPLWDEHDMVEVSHPLPTNEPLAILFPMFEIPSASVIKKRFRHAAEIYSCIHLNPHFNLSVSYGCIRDGQFVTGIVARAYPRRLNMSRDLPDRRAVVAGLRAAAEHLHRFSLVHGDFDESDIAIDDESGRFVLTELGRVVFTNDVRTDEKVPARWVRSGTTMTPEEDYRAIGRVMGYLEARSGHPMEEHWVSTSSWISSGIVVS